MQLKQSLIEEIAVLLIPLELKQIVQLTTKGCSCTGKLEKLFLKKNKKENLVQIMGVI
jgi:hypothetical protein